MIQFGPAMAPLRISHWRGNKEVLEENANPKQFTMLCLELPSLFHQGWLIGNGYLRKIRA